jgi:hypothetical protein
MYTGGGLAMLWNERVDLKLNTYSRNHIDVLVVEKGSGIEYRLTGFYGNAETSKRKESWALLKHLSQQSAVPWVCLGDFNEILEYSECLGRRFRPEWQLRDFVKQCLFVNYMILAFRDISLRGGINVLTMILSLLDWIESWLQPLGFRLLMVQRSLILAFQNLDHCPLLLTIPDTVTPSKRKRVFRFEAWWAKDEQCKGVIEEAWGMSMMEGSPMFKVVEKLKGCRASLIGWSREKFGSLAATIRDRRVLLQNLIDMSSTGHSNRIMEVQDELNSLLENEETYWSQRSRVSWMKDGDKNTKFFHAHCNQRRNTNLIRGLRDDNGVWQTEDSKMADLAVEYFQTLFTSSNPGVECINSCLAGLEAVITDDMNELLMEDFLPDEVFQALQQMYPTKVPGPDGMSAIFYQTYWEVVGPEVTQAILSILHSGYMLRKINYTHIALVPKIKNPEKMSDFRPISLCNVIYKVVSKVLANRLKKVLPLVISESQSAFVPGRLITDNVLVAFELMHSMSLKRKGRRGQMALKLDMSKAYDRVEWSFLEAIMRKLGFAEQWIKRIMMCVNSVSYSVLLNGE